MKVQVKYLQSGFIYGVLRMAGNTFSLKPIEHSTEVDDKGEPIIISEQEQFSARWMKKVGKSKPQAVESKSGSIKPIDEMVTKELKKELVKLEVDIPNGTDKAGLVKLLEEKRAA